MVQPTLSHTANVKISWEQYNKDIHKLASVIEEQQADLHCIYGIPRGGLIPAVHLSHLLDLPLVEKPYGKYLLVDDISDSGITLKNKVPPRAFCMTATLYTKKGTCYTPDFWVAEYPKEAWLIYPWEE